MKRTRRMAITLMMAVILGLFTGQLTEVNAAKQINAKNFVNYVDGRVGKAYADGMCLQFVEECYQKYGGSRPYDCCAYRSGSKFIKSKSLSNIPLGATVYFGNCGGGRCKSCKASCHGHVGIFVGNGYFVHATGGTVKKTKLSSSYWKNRYRGWGYCGNAKLSESNTVPLGAVDSLGGGINQISLGGWAYDPDSASTAIDVRIKIGWSTYTIKANQYRAGVAPTKYHGFSTTVKVNEIGRQTVVVYAVDANTGAEEKIASKTITIESKKSPVGHVDAIGGGDGVIGLSGFAYDPDEPTKAVKIKIQIVGGSSYTFTANKYRTGVTPTNYQSFSDRIPVKEVGTYDYKVYALDIGKYSTSDTLLKSGKVTINPGLSYQAYTQYDGWMGVVTPGNTAGTTGHSRQMEAMKCYLLAGNGKSGIKYRAHCRQIGWQAWKNSGEIAGTVGQGLRMEAVQLELCNGLEYQYDIEYRAHIRNIGWGPWVKNGATAGTTGQSLSIEAIQVRLVKK